MKSTEVEHKPVVQDWKIVSRATTNIFAITACSCGNEECFWTATAGRSDMYNPEINKKGNE